MINHDEQQVIALAACVQALTAVHEVATKGQFDEHRIKTVLFALTCYSPADTLAAYGGDTANLFHGLTQLERLFNDNLNRDIAQYLLAVVTLELKLVRNSRMRPFLAEKLQHFSEELESLSDTEKKAEQLILPSTIERFADLYKQTASQTEPRIMIKGNHEHLQNELSANQIRALLLAALRAAAFFRHYDGKRIDFMIKRKQYLTLTQKLKRETG